MAKTTEIISPETDEDTDMLLIETQLMNSPLYNFQSQLTPKYSQTKIHNGMLRLSTYNRLNYHKQFLSKKCTWN